MLHMFVLLLLSTSFSLSIPFLYKQPILGFVCNFVVKERF
jgi:hypothetical protein